MLFKNFRHDPAPYVFAAFGVVGGFLEAFTFYLHGWCVPSYGAVQHDLGGICRGVRTADRVKLPPPKMTPSNCCKKIQTVV